MTLFDRYLMKRFLSVFMIMYISTFGLYMVIDGFTNVDEFQSGGASALEALQRMGRYYLLQSSVFLEMVGPILSVVTVMVVFALLQKHSEIHPILAAGIPAYRLAIPFLLGTLAVHSVLIANQELIIPRIAHVVQGSRQSGEETAQSVEPIYDPNRIHIDGKKLFLSSQRLLDAKFVLPAPEIAMELTTLRASEAVYHDETSAEPGYWELRDVTPSFAQLSLTDDGEHLVLPGAAAETLRIRTSAGAEQLHGRSRGGSLVSTPELIRRIRNPSTGLVSVNSLILQLHARLTRPFMNLVSVMVIIPLIIRKDSRSLIGNMALCTSVLGTLYGVATTCHYLGSTNLIAADLAAWLPIITGGALGAWLTGVVQS